MTNDISEALSILYSNRKNEVKLQDGTTLLVGKNHLIYFSNNQQSVDGLYFDLGKSQ